MAALIDAKVLQGRKVWYVWGAREGQQWERCFPHCRSRGAFFDLLRRELGLSASASTTDVVFSLLGKTWTGSGWVDDFPIRLKAIRERARLTQAQLARKAGLSPQAIAALEQGTRAPTWGTVRRLALAVGVGEEEFKEKLPNGVEAEAMSWASHE
jgi:DNA-binding XRE family transcriptional regulator